ncbi:hypothetical protein IC615_20365 [Serratia ureilytica]
MDSSQDPAHEKKSLSVRRFFSVPASRVVKYLTVFASLLVISHFHMSWATKPVRR